MATTVASILPLPAQTATPAAVITARQTNADGASFQNVLTNAQNQTRPAAADAARDATRAAETAEAERLARDAADAATQAANAEVAATALAVQTPQPALLAADNTPLQTSPDLLPTGLAASDAQALTSPELNGIVNQAVARANQLAPEVPPANAGPAAKQSAPQTTPVPEPVKQQLVAEPALPTPLPAQPAIAPQPTADRAPLANAVAAVQPGQRQVVPTVAPAVPNPAVPAEAGSALTPTTPAEPQAAGDVAALPDVSVGTRPSNAGDRFAALASLAETIKPTGTAETNAFAATLNSPNAADLTKLAAQGVPLERPAEPEKADTLAPAPGAVNGPFSPGTPAAPRAVNAVQAPDPAAQVADNIVVHARAVVGGGKTEFQMRLDPPELGAVRVRLTSDGDSIQAQVVVSNDAIRRMIESQLPELRQRLEQAGVSVQSFDVATDPNSGSDPKGWAGFRGEAGAEFARAAAPPPAARIRTSARAGALDVIA